MSTSRASSPIGRRPRPGRAARAARCSDRPCCSSRSGRTRRAGAGVEHAGQLAPPVGVDEERAVAARPRPRAAAGRCRRSPAACRPPARRPAAGVRSSASTPASSPATGPPRGGSSRVKVTGRVVGTARADHDHLVGVEERVEARLEQGPAVELDARLVDAVHARGGAAGEDHAAEAARRARSRSMPAILAAGWHRRLARVAWLTTDDAAGARWSSGRRGLDPAANRRPARRARDARRRRPGGASRGVRPRLRRGRLRRRAVRRAARRAVRRASSAAWRPQPRHHRRGRHVRGRRRPGPAVQHPGASRGAATATYRKIHLYDSFGYRESDRLTGGADRRRWSSRSAGWQVGLMTCYDLRFPELARRLVDAGRRGARRPGGLGRRRRARSTTGARCCAARAIENTVYVVGAGQPAPRYCGHSLVVDPLGDVLAEAGGDEAGRSRPCWTAPTSPRPAVPTPPWPTAGCSLVVVPPPPRQPPRASRGKRAAERPPSRLSRRRGRRLPTAPPPRHAPATGRPTPSEAARGRRAEPLARAAAADGRRRRRSAVRRAARRAGCWSAARRGAPRRLVARATLGARHRGWLDGAGAVAVVTALSWLLATRTAGRALVSAGLALVARRRQPRRRRPGAARRARR